MKIAVYFVTLILVTCPAIGQGTLPRHESSNPVFTSTSTLVIVPAMVRSAFGEIVPNLDASHFRLTDNGVVQEVSVEPVIAPPIALVVLMQTGGAATSQFQSYSRLDTMIESMLGPSSRRVALITFDSRVEQIWPFPPRSDALYYSLIRPEEGDHGAAILDALNCAIGLLQQQPANFRRIILLLSQAQDDGSEVSPQDLMRGLAESGSTIYSLSFLTDVKDLKERRLGKPQGGKQLDPAKPVMPLLSDAGGLATSLGVVLNAIRKDTTLEIAALSGGETAYFRDEHDLETRLSILADDIHNGYSLSFTPTSRQVGFHSIRIELVKDQRAQVRARTIYWSEGTTAK